MRALALTDRDRALMHVAWSLGAATAPAMQALVGSMTHPDTFRRRLRRLHREGYLTQTRHVGPAGCVWLYSLGPRGRAPDGTRPWRPSIAQLEHTIAVGDAVVAMTRSGFASPIEVVGWQGEAELRGWAKPGEPFPDACVTWRRGEIRGVWLVEVDRATESQAAWRRKLLRYLAHQPGTVLAVTTTSARAKRIAIAASDLGVDLVATTLRAVLTEADPLVYDASHRRLRSLSESTEHRTSQSDYVEVGGSG